MSTPRHIQTVQGIYQAFGAGNIPAIIEKMAPDVRWEEWADSFAQRGGVSTLAARRGPDGVMAFFQSLGAMQIHDFKVLDLIGGERQVAAEVVIDFSVPATGRRVLEEELHLWTFNEQGQVVRFRHYVDTAKHLWAHGKALPA
jgi:hypothetical protein